MRGSGKQQYLPYMLGELHTIHGPYINGDERSDSIQLSLDLHMCTVVHMLKHTHYTCTHTIIIKK